MQLGHRDYFITCYSKVYNLHTILAGINYDIREKIYVNEKVQ